MKKLLFKLSIAAALILTIAAVGSIFLYIEINSWAAKPLNIAAPTFIFVAKGSSLTKIAESLEKQKIIDSSIRLRLYVKAKRLFSHFQAGLYQFSGDISPLQVIKTMSHGDIYKPVAVEFTIPEGFTMSQIRDRLIARGIGTKASLDQLLTDQKFIQELGIKSSTLEGYLYPATYQFFSNFPTEKEALQKMTTEFFKRLPKDYVNKAKEKGLSLPESVIFASLIERETLYDDERPLISEVIWRRLKNGSPLGIDAALIYGIQNYDGDIKWRDLKDAKNVYNTRIHKGLPPTPIASPSINSLLAVLHPADKRYYYYVRKPGPDGHHQFSRTLQEHNGYVHKWVKGK